MQPSPFTPEFDAEVQRLNEYIKRERLQDRQVRKAARLLLAKYGSLEYGTFAVLAKDWVFKSASKEIERLSSIAEQILSGQSKPRGRLSPQTIQRRLDRFSKSWGPSAEDTLQTLREKLDDRNVVRCIAYLEEIWFQKKQAKYLYDAIDELSPKALKIVPQQLQQNFPAFQDALKYCHLYLKKHHPEKLKRTQEIWVQAQQFKVDSSHLASAVKKTILELSRLLRAQNSAKRRFNPKPEFYDFHKMKVDGMSWTQIAARKNLQSKDSADSYAEAWDLENAITEEERDLVARNLTASSRPSRKPEKRYERRRKKEIQWFRKYLRPFFELVLRVSLNPFQDPSPVVALLIKTPAQRAEVRRVLHLIIMGE